MSSLLTCSDVIRFWDAGPTGMELRQTIHGTASTMTACSWNHNGQVIATAGDNGSIMVLKDSGAIVPAGILSAHEKPILGVAFSPRSRLLAAGGEAGVVEVWDLKRNNSRVTLRGHHGTVTCVSFFDDDSCVAAGDEPGKVVLHRIADARSHDETSITLPAAGGYASVTGLSMASAAAGPSTLGVSYADGGVRLWDTGSRVCLREMKCKHRGAAGGIVFHPNNPSLMATVGRDGVVNLTSMRIADKDGLVKSIQTDAPLTSLSFHHEGHLVAVGASDGTARLIDIRTAREFGGPPKKTYAGPSPPSGRVACVAFPRHPSSRATTPTSTGSSNGFSNHGRSGSSSAKVTASSGLSRRRSTTAGAPTGSTATSSYWDLKKSTAGRSARPRQMRENGGGGSGGVNREGSSGPHGHGDDSHRRRRPSQSTSSASTAAALGSMEAPPNRPPPPTTATTRSSSSGSTHPQQQFQEPRHHYHQPAAENTSSSSKSNGDYRYASNDQGTEGGGVDASSSLSSTKEEESSGLPRRHREPYGYSSSSAGRGGGGQGYGGESFSTPPRARGGSSNGAERVALPTETHEDGGAARPSNPPMPPPVTSRHSESSSPERAEATFDPRRRENGTSNGNGNSKTGFGDRGGGSGMATREGDEGGVQRHTRAVYDNYGHGHGQDEDAHLLSTPDSRGSHVDATKAGRGGGSRDEGDGGGGGSAVNGFSSPVRAPRKRTMHSGLNSNRAEQPAAAVMPAGSKEKGGVVECDSNREAAVTSVVDSGARVVSLDRSMLEQVLSSHVTGLREELRQELRNLHVDMLRQFHSLQDEQSSALSGFEERLGGLVAENQALRAENDRLRRVY